MRVIKQGQKIDNFMTSLLATVFWDVKSFSWEGFVISPKSADLIISFTLPIPAFILLSLGIYCGVRASEVFYFSVAIIIIGSNAWTVLLYFHCVTRERNRSCKESKLNLIFFHFLPQCFQVYLYVDGNLVCYSEASRNIMTLVAPLKSSLFLIRNFQLLIRCVGSAQNKARPSYDRALYT